MHPVTSAVVAVVGDGRSSDPLHERGDKRDVYEGEVCDYFILVTLNYEGRLLIKCWE